MKDGSTTEKDPSGIDGLFQHARRRSKSQPLPIFPLENRDMEVFINCQDIRGKDNNNGESLIVPETITIGEIKHQIKSKHSSWKRIS